MDEQRSREPADQNLPLARFSGPFVALAALCEKVLTEADGTISLIRVVDRITVSVVGKRAPEEMPSAPVSLNAVLGFKSGEIRGPCPVRMKLVAPSHRVLSVVELPMLLEGDDRGANLVVQVSFPAEEEGVYWFEVYVFNETLLTKMPLRILYQRMSVSG